MPDSGPAENSNVAVPVRVWPSAAGVMMLTAGFVRSTVNVDTRAALTFPTRSVAVTRRECSPAVEKVMTCPDVQTDPWAVVESRAQRSTAPASAVIASTIDPPTLDPDAGVWIVGAGGAVVSTVNARSTGVPVEPTRTE